MRPNLKLKLPSWFSPKHPIVVREQANLKAAMLWRLSAPAERAVNLLVGGVLGLVLVMGGACAISFPGIYAVLAAVLASGLELLLAATMMAQCAQVIGRERLQHTWNAVRLTTLSDAALVGGKIHALVRHNRTLWLMIYVARGIVLLGVLKTGLRPWHLQHWQEWVLVVVGIGLLALWATVTPLPGPVSHALVGAAVATFGSPKATQWWLPLVSLSLMLGYAAVHWLVLTVLWQLEGASLPFVFLQLRNVLMLWAQGILLQPVLYGVVALLSIQVLRRRLPYLRE